MNSKLKNLIYCLIVCLTATSQSVAQTDITDISFSFGPDTPLVLEWTEFQQGYRLRVENTSKNKRVLEWVAARIKPSDGFSESILKMIKISKEESCKTISSASGSNSQKICGYVVANLSNLQPRSSNYITLQVSSKQFKLPTRPIKFVLTLNETNYVSASRIIIIKPPAIQTDTDKRTIRIYTFNFLNWNLTTLTGLNLLQSDLFTINSIKRLCGRSNFLQTVCIADSTFSTFNGDFDPTDYEPLIFQGTSSNLYAKINWNTNNTGLILDFEKAKNETFPEGDYEATSTRFVGTDPSKSVSLKLEVRSHWFIVLLLIFIGLFLALVLRILQGSPVENLLHRVDKAKLNFIDTTGVLPFESNYNIKKAIYLHAWDLIEKIQKLRFQNSGIVTANTVGFSDLEEQVKKYEDLPNQWHKFMLNLKNIKRINGNQIQIPQNLQLPTSFQKQLSASQSQDLKVEILNGASISNASKQVTPTYLASFFEEIENRFDLAKTIVTANPSANQNTGIRVLIKKSWIITTCLIISAIFIYLITHEANSNTREWQAKVLIFCITLTLVSWLWTRVIWIIQWYSMIFIEFLSPKKHPNQPSLININWWDTLPIFIAILVALINGLNEFYLKLSPTPLLQQLFFIAWGFGSTTAVQALFIILEKSPLGRYF